MLRYTKEGERVFDVISKLYTSEPDLSMLEAESSYTGEVRTNTSFIFKYKAHVSVLEIIIGEQV